MNIPLVLSLFPGIGLLDRAFEEEGFCVVRGPDLLWGGDVKRFHPPAGKFDGVIGGPPCQAFSRLRHMVKANGYALAANLIPEFERCVLAVWPSWFLMENVPDAPEPSVSGYAVSSRRLNNRWFGGEQNRERRFSFGKPVSRLCEWPWRFVQPEALQPFQYAAAVCASDGGRSVPVKMLANGQMKRTRAGASMMTDRSSRTFPDACRLQGLPVDFLMDAPFTSSGKRQAVGNGVPLPMGRAIAKAVKQAMGYALTEVA